MALPTAARRWVHSATGTIRNTSPIDWHAVSGDPLVGRAPTLGPDLPSQSWCGAGSAIHPAITRCTSLIVGPIIRTTWATIRDGEMIPTPRWITDPMMLSTAPGTLEALAPAANRLSGHGFWSTVLTHSLWWGRGVIAMRTNAAGQPIAGTLTVLNPWLVSRTTDGRWQVGDEISDLDGYLLLDGQVWRIAAMPGLPPHDQQQPSGVLSRLAGVLSVGADIHTYLGQVFGDGVPSGYLKVSTPNTPAATLERIRAEWMAKHGGRRGIAVLNASVDFSPVRASPVDADATALRHGVDEDIAHGFGLSSAWLDTGGGSLTYANLVDRRRDLVDHTLSDWGSGLMSLLSSLLPDGTTQTIRWDTYSGPSATEAMTIASQGLRDGLITLPEARELLGLGRQIPQELNR
jgi:hypothetical protein